MPLAPIAVVLAAGKGTRMGSDLPKVLHEAAGKPLVTWVLEALAAAGIHDRIVVVGYGAELVERALAGGNQELRSRAQASAATPTPMLPSCPQHALELVPVLEARALALGLKPRVESRGGQLLMVLEAPGLPARQRWYVPAAYGLCQPEAA